MTKVDVSNRSEKREKDSAHRSERYFYVTFDVIEFSAMVPEVLINDPMRCGFELCGVLFMCSAIV